MPGRCKQCGLCCKAIVVSWSMQDIKNSLDEHEHRIPPEREHENDALFILRNWVELTPEEAFKVNPYLSMWYGGKDAYFYRCMRIDESNRCTIQYRKPQICSGFPWYNGVANKDQVLLFPDCGYQEDIYV